jgi:hypothetical protein
MALAERSESFTVGGTHERRTLAPPAGGSATPTGPGT